MWEWVSDWYRGDEYSRMDSRDPKGPDDGEVGVLRGGAWDNTYDELLRAADRHDRDPRDSSVNVGFRCVSSPE